MSFHPVIKLPTEYDIFDFSESYDPQRLRGLYGVGKYNEDRRGMYTTELFSPETEHARTIHMGIDIGAPEGTEVYAFDNGEIFLTGVNPSAGDYGGTLITEHLFDGKPLWVLHGHLSYASVAKWKSGDRFQKGDVLGWLGSEKENGGWNPHLHLQLSLKRPTKCDLPGVVSVKDREEALKTFPDPRLVLGPIY